MVKKGVQYLVLGMLLVVLMLADQHPKASIGVIDVRVHRAWFRSLATLRSTLR